MARVRKLKMYPTTKTYKDSDGVEHKLTAEQVAANRDKNVTEFAAGRLANALKSLDVVSNCIGSAYNWTPERIANAMRCARSKVDELEKTLNTGKSIVDAGIRL